MDRFLFTPPSQEKKDHSENDTVEIRHVQNNSIAIGRHPCNDYSFRGQQDLLVSSMHAQVHLEGVQCRLTDLTSTNGTFVNGRRITNYMLKSGDTIEFGKGGPRVKCSIQLENQGLEKTLLVPMGNPDPKSTAMGVTTIRMLINNALADAKQEGGGLRTNPTMFVRQVVAQMTNKVSKKLRYSFITVACMLVLIIFGLVYQNVMLQRHLTETSNDQKKGLLTLEKQFSKELEVSQDRIIFLQQQIENAKNNSTISTSQLKGLETVLVSERQKTSDLGKMLQSTRDSISNLGLMTKDALLSLRSFQQIARENTESIFMICAVNDGTNDITPIGSGFVAREDGIVVTNAHVAIELQRLFAEATAQYSGIVIQNDDRSHRYSILNIMIHPKYNIDSDYSPDIAWLKVDAMGSRLHPVVLASSDEIDKIDKGYEVAVIGFPGLTMNPENPVATFSRGAIGRIIHQQYLQHDCQTSGGSSGSPIFNRNGQLVGIHYGGRGNISVLVPVEIPDSAGGTKQIYMTQRIKEAVGLNEGIRADLIRSFIDSIQ